MKLGLHVYRLYLYTLLALKGHRGQMAVINREEVGIMSLKNKNVEKQGHKARSPCLQVYTAKIRWFNIWGGGGGGVAIVVFRYSSGELCIQDFFESGNLRGESIS